MFLFYFILSYNLQVATHTKPHWQPYNSIITIELHFEHQYFTPTLINCKLSSCLEILTPTAVGLNITPSITYCCHQITPLSLLPNGVHKLLAQNHTVVMQKSSSVRFKLKFCEPRVKLCVQFTNLAEP